MVRGQRHCELPLLLLFLLLQEKCVVRELLLAIIHCFDRNLNGHAMCQLSPKGDQKRQNMELLPLFVVLWRILVAP